MSNGLSLPIMLNFEMMLIMLNYKIMLISNHAQVLNIAIMPKLKIFKLNFDLTV